MRRPIVSNLHSDAPTPRARCSSVEAPHRVFIQGCPKAHSQFPPHEFTDKIGRLGYSFFPARIDYTRLRMLMDKLGRASICGGIKSQVSGRLPAKSSTPRREEEIPISFENHLRVSPSCRFPFSCVATTLLTIHSLNLCTLSRRPVSLPRLPPGNELEEGRPAESSGESSAAACFLEHPPR